MCLNIKNINKCISVEVFPVLMFEYERILKGLVAVLAKDFPQKAEI